MKFDLTFSLFFHFFLFYALLLIAVVDFNVYRIPNQLVSFLLLLAVIKSFMVQIDILWNIITAVSITCLFLLINQFYLKAKRKLAIGYGDIKLIAVLMLTFDIPTALIALWLSSLIAVPGFYLLKKVSKHNIRNEKIPFGLFLGLGYGFIALVLRDILPFSHIFESF
jgi:prepilin signal peptidase PulO-like enzyme (type II secretory pathway)